MSSCCGPSANAFPRHTSRSKSSTSTPSRPPTKPSSSDSISISTDAAGELLQTWADQPAIDHHCHPLRRWPFQLSAVELRGPCTEALDSQLAERHVVNTVAYQDAIRRIAGELDCEPSESAILTYRNAADAASYARRLLSRTATGVMLVDNGFATAESFTLPEQEQAIGITQRQIIRLETLAENLIHHAQEPREWLSAVRAALRADIGRGAVGVKTICAYRATLELQPVDTDALGVAFSATRVRALRGEHPLLSGSALSQALIREALADALGELVDRGIMDKITASNAGRQVLADNAKRVYHLTD